MTLQDILEQAVHNVLETQPPQTRVSDRDYHVSRGIIGRVTDDVLVIDQAHIAVCTHVNIHQLHV